VLNMETMWAIGVSSARFGNTYTRHRGQPVSSLMANVTVSVPDDLKKKMEHAGSVNWSEVARQAFEEAVRRREMSEAAETMDRLRESTKLSGWSGVREIRKWRDVEKKS